MSHLQKEKKKCIFLFGYCMTAQLIKAMTAMLNADRRLAEKFELRAWWLGLRNYEREFFYCDDSGCTLFCIDKIRFPNRYRKDPLSYSTAESENFLREKSAFLPRCHIPLRHDDTMEYHYVFVSPIVEYPKIKQLILWMITHNQQLSLNALKTILHSSYEYVFDFLKTLKHLPINTLIVEGNRYLPIDTDKNLFNKYVNLSRRILIDEISALGFDILRLPLELHDEFGFTKEIYRNPQDPNPRHPNEAYMRIISKELFRYIEGIENRSGGNGAGLSGERCVGGGGGGGGGGGACGAERPSRWEHL